MDAPSEPSPDLPVSPLKAPARTFLHVFLVSLKLGLTSFGGPIAHLGYFHQEFVVRRKWLKEHDYADLIALCHFLPGPTSSQVNMAVGLAHAGWKGALGAWLGFTLPSFVLMVAFASGVDRFGVLASAGWLKGLKIVAVAVVAQAVWSMGRKFCPTGFKVALTILGAGFLLSPFAPPASQLLVMAVGAFFGWLFLHRKEAEMTAPTSLVTTYGTKLGGGLLVLFVLFFLGLPLAAAWSGNGMAATFASFFRTGSLVFGGGHVVLPLLQSEVVRPGWVGDDRFLAGYGAAQALPGPLFTFAAYLGAVMKPGPHGWLGGAWCVLAIFLPSFLLVFGTLPFWGRLREMASAQAALQGANIAVVAVLLAALVNPVWTTSVHDVAGVVLAAAVLGLLLRGLPPWLVVLFGAAGGMLLWG